jgi:hypothetical protein
MARVLLDENIAHMLRNALQSSIPHHEVVTASYAGFAGLKNGALLTAALDGGFDVLVTGLEFPGAHHARTESARTENEGRDVAV